MFITVSEGPKGQRQAAQVRRVEGCSIQLSRRGPNGGWLTWSVDLARPAEGWFPVATDAALLRALAAGTSANDPMDEVWMREAADGVLKMHEREAIHQEVAGAPDPEPTTPAEILLAAARAQGAGEEQLRCTFVCEYARNDAYGKPEVVLMVNRMAISIAHGKSTSKGAVDRPYVAKLLETYVAQEREDAFARGVAVSQKRCLSAVGRERLGSDPGHVTFEACERIKADILGGVPKTQADDELFQARTARDTWASLVDQCRDALGLRHGQDLLRAIKVVRARAEIERTLYPAAAVYELLKHLKTLRQVRDEALDLATFIDQLEVDEDARHLGGPRSEARGLVASLMRREGMMPKNAVTARLVDESVPRCRHCSERALTPHALTCSALHYAGAAKVVDLKWCGDTDPPEGEGG